MTRYDLIIPIGSVCKTSHNLRSLKRQYESLPFDWILIPDLHMVTSVLQTRFKNFLKYENMNYQCKESEQTDIYFDHGTGIGFWHDFPHNIPLEQSFDSIRKKYDRRIERLFSEIEKAEDILLFRVCTVRPDSGYSIEDIIYAKSIVDDDTILAEFQKIKALFPDKNISLLEVSLFNTPHKYLKRVIHPALTRIEAYSAIDFEWQGDIDVFKKILADHHLKLPVLFRYKLSSLRFKARKFFINLGAKLGIEKYKQDKKKLKNRFNI